ncbi:uncharacterized protein [Rutidosis leptorrhynchoides]|uniref:uncharacterized protein n=1 Tax=Rutidosis leptorrhynchoides TaxID=125765 RepID=UPI003A997EA3
MYCSFIYGSNNGKERVQLWDILKMQSRITKNHPLILLGDFSVTRSVEEHSCRSSAITEEMKEFSKCLNEIEVDDLGSTGFHFTWTKSLNNPNCGTLKKFDRILCNEEFITNYPQANEKLMPFLVSDYSPTVITLPNGLKRKKKSFRFMNHGANKDDFIRTVEMGWNEQISGHKMFQVVTKLKNLKRSLKNLNWDNALIEYDKAKADELIVLQQKAKIQWLTAGDNNTRFFHSVLKNRMQKNRIDSIYDEHGLRFEGDHVVGQSVNHFKCFLGDKGKCRPIDELGVIFTKVLDTAEANSTVISISNDEIKGAMFDIDNNKASGPDGYSALSFYESLECCRSIYL